MKKTITLFGQEITIAFNMAVQIAYEEILEVPFRLSDLQFSKNRMVLYFAVILKNNPDTDISIDKIYNEATMDDINLLDSSIDEVMRDWYHLPATLTPPSAETTEESDDEDPKNA